MRINDSAASCRHGSAHGFTIIHGSVTSQVQAQCAQLAYMHVQLVHLATAISVSAIVTASPSPLLPSSQRPLRSRPPPCRYRHRHCGLVAHLQWPASSLPSPCSVATAPPPPSPLPPSLKEDCFSHLLCRRSCLKCLAAKPFTAC
mmetsp:Transcript_56657/g.112511  ORF Transcript_56657/g.112511 Transcript_56657/m.112511 type:complete len:145 (-) Transcript_56657:244-678(-)